MDSILISTAHTHTPCTPREKRTDINIYLITHTHAQNKSRSEIAFVVLRLHCQLKVVPEGPSMILSKSGIEHRPFCARTLTWVPGAVGSHAKESAAMHRLPYRGVSAATPYGGHPSASDSRGPGRRTLPHAAHLFLPSVLEALG
jgi:hypothetical protein